MRGTTSPFSPLEIRRSATTDYADIFTPAAIDALAEVQQTVVLFDQSHSNAYSLPEIDPLTNAIMTLGGDVRSLESGADFEYELKLANALVLIAPVFPSLRPLSY